MSSKKNWKVLEEHIYERFPIFTIKKSIRENPRTGARFDFFLMDGLDWANIIPVTDEGEVIMVEQYRQGAETLSLELPGGCIEHGETPEAGVTRELREETGFQVSKVESLGVFHPNPAMQSMRCHAFLGSGAVSVSGQSLDPGEEIQVVRVKIEDIPQLISEGKITHSIVLAAFTLFQARLQTK